MVEGLIAHQNGNRQVPKDVREIADEVPEQLIEDASKTSDPEVAETEQISEELKPYIRDIERLDELQNRLPRPRIVDWRTELEHVVKIASEDGLDLAIRAGRNMLTKNQDIYENPDNYQLADYEKKELLTGYLTLRRKIEDYHQEDLDQLRTEAYREKRVREVKTWFANAINYWLVEPFEYPEDK